MPVPLLLVAGLNCDHASWSAVAARLRAVADVRIPAYPRLPSIAAMARELLAAAPPRFAVAGHSMGARVAVEAMRLAPERIERLALLDTGYAPGPAGAAGDAERSRRYALVDLARRQGMRAMAAEWIRGMVAPGREGDAALVEAMTAMIARFAVEAFEAQVAALLDRPDAAPVLRGATVPVLVGCGRHDAWAPLAQHEALAALVPGSRLVVFEGAGHMAPMEAPDAVAAALVDWLAMPPADRRAAEIEVEARGA